MDKNSYIHIYLRYFFYLQLVLSLLVLPGVQANRGLPSHQMILLHHSDRESQGILSLQCYHGVQGGQ